MAIVLMILVFGFVAEFLLAPSSQVSILVKKIYLGESEAKLFCLGNGGGSLWGYDIKKKVSSFLCVCVLYGM
jgi:hypothetical protein